MHSPDGQPKLGMNMLLWSSDVTGPRHRRDVRVASPRSATTGSRSPSSTAKSRSTAALGARLEGTGAHVPRRRRPFRGRQTRSARTLWVEARGLEATKAAVDACAALEHPDAVAGPLEAPLRSSAAQGRRATSASAPSRACGPRPSTRRQQYVTMAIQSLNRFEMYLVNCAEAAAALVREVDHPNCRMMYNTFHAHIEESDPGAAVPECGDVLVHLPHPRTTEARRAAARSSWDTTFDALLSGGLRRLGGDRSVRRLAARPRRGDQGLAADVLE